MLLAVSPLGRIFGLHLGLVFNELNKFGTTFFGRLKKGNHHWDYGRIVGPVGLVLATGTS